ncbi:Carboxypeptidase regulatory-like domain protein [uncultured archaeon]|nr:Carboxypeptidase regulatory-like domain protein [uncultured archaeon]
MRFFFVFAVALALALPICMAAANESLPPAAPSGGAVFGHAQFTNGSPIADSPLVILARSNSSDTIYRLITGPSGNFVLALGPGQYDIDALLADSSTSVIDHAATGQADSSREGNLTLIFYPAGSVAGTALSGGSPVPGAKVKVACPSSGFDYVRVNGGATVLAGDAGDFLFKALPTGSCIISASTGSLAGSVEAAVQYEKTSTVSVEMKQKAAGFDYASFVLPLAIVAIVSAYFGRMSNRHPVSPAPRAQPAQGPESAPLQPAHQKKKAQQPEEEKGMESMLSDPKVKAVLSTLSDREREIVRFLFKSGGRAKRSTIQHKLLIPKTSLLRNLRSLERKKIVKLTPFGRNLLAEIEGWMHQ